MTADLATCKRRTSLNVNNLVRRKKHRRILPPEDEKVCLAIYAKSSINVHTETPDSRCAARDCSHLSPPSAPPGRRRNLPEGPGQCRGGAGPGALSALWRSGPRGAPEASSAGMAPGLRNGPSGLGSPLSPAESRFGARQRPDRPGPGRKARA